MNKKMNFLFILSDDQGAWALHSAGNADVITPNLDELAREGNRFENFFCVSPVCSPARASILTGKIPSCHGVHDWLRSGSLNKEDLGEIKDSPCFHDEKKAIPYLEGQITYTDILAQNGYQCALAGKWHLGDSVHPQHGFSKWFTIGRGGCPYYHPDIVDEGHVYFDDRYITDIITDKAMNYLDELSSEKKPFYLAVNFTAPHSPWEESDHPKEYLDMYRNCEFNATPNLPINPNQIPSAPYGTGERRKELLRGYYTAITAMDAQIGRLIAHLKEIDEWDNTVVIFSGDNGMNMGHHGIWGKGNGTFPLNLYDTAVKVPMIIRIPAKEDHGRIIHTMHSHYDLFQTILEIAGINYEKDEKLPGNSLIPALFEKDEEDGDLVICDEYGANRMIRTKEWKYIHRYPYGPHELYYLIEDPDENNNLIDDPSCLAILKSLRKRLNLWFFKYADDKMDASREAVTGYGQMQKSGIYSDGGDVYFRQSAYMKKEQK